MMKFLSLGLGVQSTALYYMSSMGILPRVDYAIFADPGREKTRTMKYLQFLCSWQSLHDGIPIIIVNERNLFRDLLDQKNSNGNRFQSIPAYTKNEDGSIGMLRRQCTGEYKIWQVDKMIRTLYGLKSYARMPRTEVWKGITLDEIERISIPPEAWKVQIYPLAGWWTDYKKSGKLEWGTPLYRYQCEQWYKDNKLPMPVKSSCIFCPYQSDASWNNMKRNEPEDFADAVKIDQAIRNSTKKGIKQPCYLHESGIPLVDIEFREDTSDLWKGECSGECHS
jgi:hypothetical protein